MKGSESSHVFPNNNLLRKFISSWSCSLEGKRNEKKEDRKEDGWLIQHRGCQALSLAMLPFCR